MRDKLVKRGPTGERLATWTLSPGQDVEYSGGDLGWSATVDPEGGVWLADTLCGTVDFGPGPVSGELVPIRVHFVQQQRARARGVYRSKQYTRAGWEQSSSPASVHEVVSES
jgi:hypothetical protein